MTAIGTELGAVLDMVIDRFSNALIFGVLATLFPDYRFLFYLMIVLDFSSHWILMYA